MARKRGCYRRRQAVRKVKKDRYDQKELQRLKKTLGLIDGDGNEVMKNLSDIATIKSAKELKLERQSKEEQEVYHEMNEKKEEPETVTVVNEKTGVVHNYNTKTQRDQYGSYPPWYKYRKMAKRLRKKAFAQKNNFKQMWRVTNVML